VSSGIRFFEKPFTSSASRRQQLSWKC